MTKNDFQEDDLITFGFNNDDTGNSDNGTKDLPGFLIYFLFLRGEIDCYYLENGYWTFECDDMSWTEIVIYFPCLLIPVPRQPCFRSGHEKNGEKITFPITKGLELEGTYPENGGKGTINARLRYIGLVG